MVIDPNLLERPQPKLKIRTKYMEAKHRAEKSGKTVYEEYQALQDEQLENDVDWRVQHAPKMRLDGDGRPIRVSRSTVFPYGVDDDGELFAPYGLNEFTKRPIIDKVDALFKNEAKNQGIVKKVNKVKAQATILETLEKLGCDPIEGMARIAMDSTNETGLRLRAYTELAQYVYPKKRAVEHTGDAAKQQIFVIGVPQQQHKDAETWLQDVTPKIIDQEPSK